MGGNATVQVKKTGELTEAQKIPIGDIGRRLFIEKFTDIFYNINDRFEQKYKSKLWEDISILSNGVAFNGSTSFIMNPLIEDSEIIPFKSSSGDIDIMVPKQHAVKLWHLLDTLENTELQPGVMYKGSNRKTVTSIGNQIISVFEVVFDNIKVYAQVDFELVEFINDKPNEFARFSHSSSITDTKNGFKGIAHKYILRALAGGCSRRNDAIVITPTSTFEKYMIQKKNKEAIIPNFLKFSVTRGLREAYIEQLTPDGKPWIIDGKSVYKEIQTDNSDYITSVKDIFCKIFNTENLENIDKMWSFVGITELIKTYLTDDQIEITFNRLLELQWSQVAQQLERDNPALDLEIKSNIANYMIDKFPILEQYTEKMKLMIDKYYINYKGNINGKI